MHRNGACRCGNALAACRSTWAGSSTLVYFSLLFIALPWPGIADPCWHCTQVLVLWVPWVLVVVVLWVLLVLLVVVLWVPWVLLVVVLVPWVLLVLLVCCPRTGK